MEKLNYKDIFRLKKYITKKGKILPRAKTGLSPKEQRLLAVEVKRARYVALLPYASKE
jgi:small subunit ribosomal protein S18